MSKNIVNTNPHVLKNYRLHANFISYLDDRYKTEETKLKIDHVKPLSIEKNYTRFFDSRDPNRYKEKMLVLLEREIMRQHFMKKLFPFYF